MNGTKVRKVSKSTDLYKLHQIIGGIVGKRCWRVGFGYGGDLRLHFGKKIAYENRMMEDEKKGAWRFATSGTSWKLVTPKLSVSSKTGKERNLERKARTLEGKAVTKIEFILPSNIIRFTFTNKCWFLVIPDAEDDKYDLPYWKLFMPDGMLVTFGPGKHWSCMPSDLPISNESPPSGHIGSK